MKISLIPALTISMLLCTAVPSPARSAIHEGVWVGSSGIQFTVVNQTTINPFKVKFTFTPPPCQGSVEVTRYGSIPIVGGSFTIDYSSSFPRASGRLTGTFSDDGIRVSGSYEYNSDSCRTSSNWTAAPAQSPPTNPTGTGAANPSNVTSGSTVLLVVTVTPGANPPSTGITVRGNLSEIGGSSSESFFDNGTNGDETSADGKYSFRASVSAATKPGTKSLSVTISDAQSRSSTASIQLTVVSPARFIFLSLGSYPSAGGWMEVLRSDLSHDSWIATPWGAYNSANGETRPAAGDLDGDGKDEIVVGFGPVTGNASMPGGWFEVLDDSYTHLAWGQVQHSSYNAANGETFPACGDVDGDGKAEIIIGLGSYGAGGGWIQVFDFDAGSLVHKAWIRVQWSAYNAANGKVRPSCGDLDGDGRAEIVAGLGMYPSSGGWFEVFDDANSAYVHVAWGQIQWNAYSAANGELRPACGDLDGDGKDEIVVGFDSFSGQGGWLETFDFESRAVLPKGWFRVQFAAYNDANGETYPACADLDGDGKAEIVVGLGSYAVNGGWLEVFDDALAGHAHVAWGRLNWSQYNATNGRAWPAIVKK